MTGFSFCQRWSPHYFEIRIHPFRRSKFQGFSFHRFPSFRFRNRSHPIPQSPSRCVRWLCAVAKLSDGSSALHIFTEAAGQSRAALRRKGLPGMAWPWHDVMGWWDVGLLGWELWSRNLWTLQQVDITEPLEIGFPTDDAGCCWLRCFPVEFLPKETARAAKKLPCSWICSFCWGAFHFN